MNKKIELLAPAGDFEKLKSAIKFGADAVYLAGESYGLRKNAKNFSNELLKEAVSYAHDHGVKVHITMNIVPHDEDLIGIVDYLKYLDTINVDALIISDPGIFQLAKENTKIDLHISTQASVTNIQTIKFWQQLGAKRVILARELSFDEIVNIRNNIDKSLEIECFVHGAMCISYSGRCLLSNYMTNRDSNRGDCAHACRWKYSLVEENRPGEYYPIVDDPNGNGSFILNSKDLCLLDEMDKLIEAGVDSVKIEGRMKTQFYVSTVIRSYRQVIDSYYRGEFNDEICKKYIDEIKKASHRHFTKAFFYGQADDESQIYDSSTYIRGYDFIAQVLDYDKDTKIATLEQRNRFFKGDEVEIFGNSPEYITVTLDRIFDGKDNELEVCNVPRRKVYARIEHPLEKGDLVRRKI